MTIDQTRPDGTSALSSVFAAKLEERRRSRAADEDETGRPRAGGPRPYVLVVDDEPEVTRSVAELLGRDYEVLTATSAEEGLALLEAHSVAVILTDQRMPGSTGAELLARAVAISPETTRLLFTAYSDISAVIDAVNGGQVYRYISKPWQPDELKAILGEGLERYRLVVENRRLVVELTKANERLEHRVLERTRQLREQNRVLREARRTIEELSRRDPLTGLANRRSLDDLLRLEVERAKRYEVPLSVVMADLDHFKEVNDSFGHVVGDQVLRAVAQALQGAVRMTDIVGRFGGEEFLVILPNTGLTGARVIAERMARGLRRMPVTFRSEPVTASFGVAEWAREDSVAGLVARADEGLYEAKRGGRDRVATSLPEER